MTDLADAAISFLAAYFENTSWPDGLNREKLHMRAGVVFESGSTLPIIEIERHRSVLGDQYIGGCPMSAFLTYFMRYKVDMANNAVSQLPERNADIRLDVSGLVKQHLSADSFCLLIEETDGGQYQITESVSHQTAEISTEQGAVDFALTFEDAFADYFDEDLQRTLADCELLDDRSRKGLASEYRKALVDELAKHGRDAWRNR